MASTLVIAFGRFNPPTIGHGELFDHLLSRARATSGKVVLFVSNTVDHPNNPLSHAEKSALIRQSFPAITVGPTTVKTPYEALTRADKSKVSSVIFVVGRDRLDQFKRMVDNWKRVDGKDSATRITVEDSGARTKGISGTDARALARKGDFAGFKRIALPRLPDSAIKRTITTIQNGLREMANYTEFDILLEADDTEDKPSAEDAKKEIAALKDRLATLEKVVGGDDEGDNMVEVDAADDSEDDSPDTKETKKSDKKSAPPKTPAKKDDAGDDSGKKKSSFPALSHDKKEDDDGESDSKPSAPKGKFGGKKEDNGNSDKKPAPFGKSASTNDEDSSDDTIEVDAPEDEDNPNAKEKVAGEDSAQDSKDDGEGDKPEKGNPFGDSSKEDAGDIEVDAPVDEDGEPIDEDPPDPADRVDSDRPDNQSKVVLHPPQRLLFTMGQRYTPPEVEEEDDEKDDDKQDGKAPFGNAEDEDLDNDEDEAEIEVDAPEDDEEELDNEDEGEDDEEDDPAKKKKDERFKNAK